MTPSCMCTFDSECSGTGIVHCLPPCGGDLCICRCGGELECDGCENCDAGHDEDLDAADRPSYWDEADSSTNTGGQ